MLPEFRTVQDVSCLLESCKGYVITRMFYKSYKIAFVDVKTSTNMQTISAESIKANLGRTALLERYLQPFF